MVWLYQETPKWQELLHFLFDQSATSLLDRIFAAHHPITFHASNVLVCLVSNASLAKVGRWSFEAL